MKKCKSCQTEIDENAKKCPNCREDQRSWFAKHKIMTAILALILIGIIASVAGSGSGGNNNNNSGNDGGSSSTQDAEKSFRFNDRADKQEKDVEIAVGESGTVDGLKLTVLSAERKTSLGEFSEAPDGKQYVVANVTLENTSDEVKPYNVFNFRIQTSGGQVLDVYFGGTNDLSSGDLTIGGKATGNVTFEVPVETATQYIIFKPNAAKSDRVIVEVKQ